MSERVPDSNNEVFSVALPGQDEASLQHLASGQWRLEAVGCASFLQLLRDLAKSSRDPRQWPMPKGNSHAEMLVRELIFKARGEWKFPYEHAELCHCRAVPTIAVDQAILAGAHSIERVRSWTSANTACGTCKPDVEQLLNFRQRGG